MMAASDRFHITIRGKGGHGAQPHLTKDAIVIGSQVVTSLQQIVSRRLDPLHSGVLSVGSFEAVNAFNVIADSAKLTGTTRCFDENVRDIFEEEIGKIVRGTCEAAGAEADYEYLRGYPPVDNHRDEARFIAECAEKTESVQKTEYMSPSMAGEDYAHYLRHVKGTYFFTGAGHPDWETTYPHHHSKFDIDERAMLTAAQVIGRAVLEYPGPSS
jgi:amidohydrolase